MSIKKHIPNIITLLNLFSGCIALVFAANRDFEMAFYFVCLGIFLDFFDGFFARLYNVAGELGLQLDSLADMVTSGVVPGYVMFYLMADALKVDFSNGMPDVTNPSFLFCLLGFIITMGSCYRLANFNIETRQTSSFIGLPTPANALFILSLPLVKMAAVTPEGNFLFFEILTNQYVLLVITLFSAYIMNAEIPLFSLKIAAFSIQKNAIQILFLLSSLLILVFFQFAGIPLVILGYVLLSIINNKVSKK